MNPFLSSLIFDQFLQDLPFLLLILEGGWLSGYSAGLVIWKPQVQVSPCLPAGFVIGSPEFKSTLVNSQLVRLLPVGILKHNHYVLFE